MEVWIVITADIDSNQPLQHEDVEILDSEPMWGPEDIPSDVMQEVRRGNINGGDSLVVRVFRGTGPVRTAADYA